MRSQVAQDQPTQLYRHFDARGRLLYIGIAASITARLVQHSKHSHWQSDIARVDVEMHPTRLAALAAEAAAIAREKPLHNVRGIPAAQQRVWGKKVLPLPPPLPVPPPTPPAKQGRRKAAPPKPAPPVDIRIIRLPEVMAMTGMAKTTLHRLEACDPPRFPRRLRLGVRAVGWRISEVTDWLNAFAYHERDTTVTIVTQP